MIGKIKIVRTGGYDPDAHEAAKALAALLDDVMTHLRMEDTTPIRIAEGLVAKGVRPPDAKEIGAPMTPTKYGRCSVERCAVPLRKDEAERRLTKCVGCRAAESFESRLKTPEVPRG